MVGNVETISYLILILVSWVSWHLLWEWMVYEMRRDKYEGLLIASVVEAIFATAAFLVNVQSIGVGNKEVLPNNMVEIVHMIASAGFFLHDTPHWEPRISLTNVTMLLHHLLSISVILMVLLHGSCGSFLLELSALMELSTPLLLVRYYQLEAGHNAKPIEVAYTIFFVILRLWYGANLGLVVLQNEQVPILLKVMCSLVLLTSYCLFPGVIRMAVSKSPVPRTRRTPRTSPRRGQARMSARGTTIMKRQSVVRAYS